MSYAERVLGMCTLIKGLLETVIVGNWVLEVHFTQHRLEKCSMPFNLSTLPMGLWSRRGGTDIESLCDSANSWLFISVPESTTISVGGPAQLIQCWFSN